jgi:hypothetical protein
MDARSAPPDTTIEVHGLAVLFGYDSTEVRVSLRPRQRKWRLGGAARITGTSLLVAPIVGLVPPHAPWVVGALGCGVVLARRRWNERFTVERVRGECPRCGGALSVRSGRLKDPHPLPCEECHHESALRVDVSGLSATGEPPS